MNAPTTIPQVDVEKLVTLYVKCRDEKARIKKEALGPLNKAMEAIETQLLNVMNQTGTTSLKSDAGTAYQQTRKSATISDPQEFRRFVIGSEAWDIVDWRANVVATEAFIAENNDTPPGVKWTTAIKVNVNRA